MLGLELESRHLLESAPVGGQQCQAGLWCCAEIHLPGGKQERTGEVGTGRKNGNKAQQTVLLEGRQ